MFSFFHFLRLPPTISNDSRLAASSHRLWILHRQEFFSLLLRSFLLFLFHLFLLLLHLPFFIINHGSDILQRREPNRINSTSPSGWFPFDGSRLGAIPSRHVAYARSANKGLFRLVVADMIYGKGEGNVVGRVETGLQPRPRCKGSGVIGDARPLSPLRAPTCTNATTCHLERGKEASERTRRRKKEEGQSGALEKRLSAVKNAGSSSFA